MQSKDNAWGSSRKAHILKADDFFAALRSGRLHTGTQYRAPLAMTEDGRPITLPVKLLRRPDGPLIGRPLIVVFHGAINQKKTPFPQFIGSYALKHLADTDAIMLAVSDPSLWLSQDLRTAWYSANRYVDTPQAIHGFLYDVCDILSPARLILTGNSTGAHAALVHSARFPDSICIVSSPITRISGYYAQTVARYLAVCWGRDERAAPILPDGVLDDCGTLYRNGHAHSVIVLQNATDPHLPRQALPFAAQIRNHDRFLLLSTFYPDFDRPRTASQCRGRVAPRRRARARNRLPPYRPRLPRDE